MTPKALWAQIAGLLQHIAGQYRDLAEEYSDDGIPWFRIRPEELIPRGSIHQMLARTEHGIKQPQPRTKGDTMAYPDSQSDKQNPEGPQTLGIEALPFIRVTEAEYEALLDTYRGKGWTRPISRDQCPETLVGAVHHLDPNHRLTAITERPYGGGEEIYWIRDTSPLSSIPHEPVAVVPRPKLFPTTTPHGLILTQNVEKAQRNPPYLHLDEVRRHITFRHRSVVEKDSAYKQIIPYCLIRQGGAYLVTQRLKTQGESRLHGAASLGIGGHWNTSDPHIYAALRRELREELALDTTTTFEPRILGIVNDDTTPVGSVHFGVVFLLDLIGDESIRLDTNEMHGRFVPPAELDEFRREVLDGAEWESWSKFLADAILDGNNPVRKEA